MSVLMVLIIIRICVTRQGAVWLVRGSQARVWVFGLKPQDWVQARRAVIPANYSQGLHQDSLMRQSLALSSLFQTAVSLIALLIFP